MPALTWDDTGKRFYETGVDHGVLYPIQAEGAYTKGVAWNGLSSVNESPSGAESTPIYADNMKYLNLTSNEDFGATIEAYTYPDEFAECDGTAQPTQGVMFGQQSRKIFGMSYRTKVGNDEKGEDLGYKIHLIYGAKASPSQKSYSTINDSPEAITFSWELTTTPIAVKAEGMKPTAYIVIDSRTADPEKLKALEAILYGGEAEARLPLPDEIITLMTPAAA